jgi:hypothetical protein
VDFEADRMLALMSLKGIKSQKALAAIVGVSQPCICDLLKGKQGETPIFLSVADALDCETDFLYVRGRYARRIDLSAGSVALRQAASDMALVFFASKDSAATPQHLDWCRRVQGHEAAPITAVGWRYLVEQIELARGPQNPAGLREVG